MPNRDGAFHRGIHAASGNAILNYLGSLIASLMQVQVLMTTDLPESFERGLPLHRELTEAILRGGGPAAEDTSSRLIQMPYNDLAGRKRLAATERLSAAGPARAGRGRSRTIASGCGP